MRQNKISARVALLLAITTVWVHAQSSSELTANNVSARPNIYIDPHSLQLNLIIPPPPLQNSPITATELDELHGIEGTRTAAQVAQAKIDDREESIFLFKPVIGPGFDADSLPLTAALSKHIRKDASAASVDLKNSYQRPRPYQVDATLHPVCIVTQEPNSYPSGHSLSGYLLSFTLIQMLPEKRQQILDRADQYAHNRLICGVHYASDIEASRNLAYAVFGSLAASPQFQKELATARAEVRQKLGLPLLANP